MKKSWNRLAQTAAWILSIVGTFLIPPPAGAAQYEQKGAMRSLAVFTIAVIVGLMVLPLKKWAKKCNFWWWVASGALIASLASLISYEHLTSKWTCDYN